MSRWIITKDLDYWLDKEKELIEVFTTLWYELTETSLTDILDFTLLHNWNKVNVELKSRRCSREAYPDTMIWANKLAEAYKKFYTDWEETLFIFNYDDWIYYVNPFTTTARIEYKKFRWDRWGFDKPKGYLFYNTNELCLLVKH